MVLFQNQLAKLSNSGGTVVVTGANGFLGKLITKSLVKAGNTVIPVSRKVLLPGGCVVKDYCEIPDGDILIHLAEESNRQLVNSLGESYADTSLATIKKLALRGWNRIIYASSSAVYGDLCSTPRKPNSMLHVTDTYTQVKVRSEELVLSSDGCVLRLSNIIGNGMSSKNVLSDIIAQVPGTGPVYVRDNSPVRDYLSVEDAASAFVQVIRADITGISNVGSGVATSVQQLAETVLLIAQETHREIKATAPSLSPSYNVLDISQTVETVGWSPLVTLNEQIARLFD